MDGVLPFLLQVVSHALPSQDIMAFTHSLLEQLGTVNMACDKGAILWFGTVARECAPDLRDKVSIKGEANPDWLGHGDLVARNSCLWTKVSTVQEPPNHS